MTAGAVGARPLRVALVAVLEQGASSALSFLLLAITARALLPADFGIVSTGWQVVAQVLTFAAGTVLAALAVYLPGAVGGRRLVQGRFLQQLGRWLALAGLGATVVLWLLGAFAGLGGVVGALAAGLAASLGRVALELDRRWLVLTGRQRAALLLGTCSLMVVLGLLLGWWWLVPAAERRPMTALLLAAAGLGLVSLLARGRIGQDQMVASRNARRWLQRRYLAFCRWSLPTTLLALVGGLATPFAALALLGATEAGGFNAARALFGVLQLPIIGLSLHVAAGQRLAWLAGGSEALMRATLPWVLATGLAGLVATIVAWIWGDVVLHLAFGPEFRQFQPVLVALGLHFCLIGAGCLSAGAINAAGRLGWNLAATAAGATITVPLFAVLAQTGSVAAATLSLVVAELVIVAIRIWGLRRPGAGKRCVA